MCGIIGVLKRTNQDKDSNSVYKTVHRTLQDQLSRGKEGFGFSVIDNKNTFQTFRATELMSILIELKMETIGAKGVIFHHRMPTSTPNKIGQTHPIVVSNEALKHDYLVIHNGVISNTEELREKHDKLNFIYTTDRTKEKSNTENKSHYTRYQNEDFNDSESIAIELALAIEGGIQQVRATGSAALIAYQVKKGTNEVINMFAWRNDRNPIKVQSDKSQVLLSSEGPGVSVEPFMLFKFDMAGKVQAKELTVYEKQRTLVPTSYEATNKKEVAGFQDKNKKDKEKEEFEKLLKELNDFDFDLVYDKQYEEAYELYETIGFDNTEEEGQAKVTELYDKLESPEDLLSLNFQKTLTDTLAKVATETKNKYEETIKTLTKVKEIMEEIDLQEANKEAYDENFQDIEGFEDISDFADDYEGPTHKRALHA